MTTPTTRARRLRGASMMELCATLSLVAVLLGTLSPVFAQVISGFAVRTAVRHVFADLQKARMSAATENNRYVFRVVNAHAYSVHDDNDGDGLVDAGETVRTVDLQRETRRVTISGPSVLTFVPDGRALASATVTVRGARGGPKTITVTDAGRVQLQ